MMTPNMLRTALQAAMLAVLSGAATAGDSPAARNATDPAASDVQRGRYMVKIGGCNDCHTHGYSENAGKVDEQHWLAGSRLGWRGPWGTTYASNLRLVAQGMNGAQWLRHARNEWRPPMPWFNLREMSDDDLLAIYRFLRYLGPAGEPAPAYVPPGEEPATQVVVFGPPPP